MSLLAVLAALWPIFAGLTACALIGAGVGGLAGDGGQPWVYLIAALVYGSIAAALRAMRTLFQSVGDAREVVLFVVLAWLTAPLAAAPMMLLASGVDGPVRALFEAVSALTTTGASVMADPRSEASAFIVWRVSLGWFGGLGAFATAVSVLSSVYSSGPGARRFSTIWSRGIGFTGMARPVAALATVLAGVSFAVFAGCLAGGAGWRDALVLALTAPVTNGFTILEGSVLETAGPLGVACVAGGALVGALSAPTLLVVRARDIRDALADRENTALFAAIGLAALFIAFDSGDWLLALPDAASLMSTYGLALGGGERGLGDLAHSAVIAGAMIGGAAVSTAGGVKLGRLLLLGAYVNRSLFLLSHPAGVAPVSYRGRRVTLNAFLGAWVYFALFALALGLVATGLGMMNMPADAAFAASAAALSNAGPVLGHVAGPEHGWGQMGSGALALSSFAMILGRVEILALLVFVNPAALMR